MSFVRQMVLSLVAVALFAGPAAAQTYWGNTMETRAGETMAVAYAYIGDNPNASYPYVLYGVLRSRPEGYFRQWVRVDCSNGSVVADSSSFVLWGGRSEAIESTVLNLLPEGGRDFAWAIQCAGYRSPTFVEGSDEALRLLREFQTTP